jgi:hypothetical protein
MSKEFYFGHNDEYFKIQYKHEEGSGKWNKKVSTYIKKINNSVDDRAYVIFAAGLLEKQISEILYLIFPKHKFLEESECFTFSMKIRILKATSLLPNQILNFADLVRELRNVFAHNIEIENFEDFSKIPKLDKKLKKLDSYCSEWSSNLVKSQFKSDPRTKFDDLYRLSLGGLFCYETNVKILFETIWDQEFRSNLDNNHGINAT